jgi:hypothetical protein
VTPEEIGQAAAAVVARTTHQRGHAGHLEDPTVADQLAAAVADVLLGGGGGPDPPSRPGPAKAPVAPENLSSPKEKPEHGQP